MINLSLKKELVPFDPFLKIGKEWALLGVAADGVQNAMTVSWGECGVLWNKNVFTAFVRPERYTHSLLEKTDIITLSFFGKENRDILTYFGRTSGRDEDKILKSGLDVSVVDGALVFHSAELVLVGRVIYKNELTPESFVDKDFLKHYDKDGFHTAYTCQIVGVYEKD